MTEKNLEDLLIGKYMNKTAELLPDQKFNPLQQYSVVCLFFAASWCKKNYFNFLQKIKLHKIIFLTNRPAMCELFTKIDRIL